VSIPAKRFQFLDQETDVAVADFFSAKDAAILSSPNLEVPDISDDMQNFFSQLTQAAETAETPSDDLLRQAKGAMGSFKSLGTLSTKDVQSQISGLIPNNPIAQNAFKQLSTSCQANSQKRISPMKPYNAKVSCGAKSRIGKDSGGCAPGSFGDLLNKLTGGAYKNTVSDRNKILQNLLNLTGMGYSMNMCGVFGALSTGVDLNVLSRASGLMFSELGSTKNTLGVFDLAGASAGLAALKEVPSGISNFLGKYINPTEVKENSYGDLGDRLTGSMELFDPNWNKSSFDGSLSTGFSDTFSPDLDKLFSSKAMDRTITASSLNDIPDDDMGFMSMAYKGKQDGFSMKSLFA
jgi:hypothetical protein